MEWIDTLLQGLLLGGFFALSGLGLSLSFGIMRIVNIAHGDLLIVAAYLGVVLVGVVGGVPLVAVIVAVPLMFLLGYLIQWALLNRAVDKSELTPLLITFGLSIVLRNVLQELFSANFKRLDAGSLGVASFSVGPVTVGWFPVVILAVALVTYGSLSWAITHTRFGRMMRATVDDPEITGLMGIDTRRMYCLGMGLSMAIVGIAGGLFAIKTSFNPMTGGDQLLFAFESVIIGGMGSIWGTFMGGLSLGIAQMIGFKINAGWGAFAGHLVFFLFLFLKPAGLLAKGGRHV